MLQIPENRDFVFIDDAHTFGGTQIALAWVIRVVLQKTQASVLCICSQRTWEAVVGVVGNTPRLSFEEAPSALSLNLLRFPIRLPAWWFLLRRVRKEGDRIWWLNLADIEFCLAPLLVLCLIGEFPHSYLHGTSPFAFFHREAPIGRRLLSRFRDGLANRFVFRLHSLLVTPSIASLDEVKHRIRSTRQPRFGYLYYAPIGENANLLTAPISVEPPPSALPISIWMIGNVVQGHKNNLAALDLLQSLDRMGIDANLTIAGVGPDLAAFQTEAKRRNLSERIRYLGWVANPCDTAPKDAIVFIPSFHETMNIVAREAMRNGLRLVASPIKIFHEWIPQLLIASSFAPDAFASKLVEVYRMDASVLGALYGNALARFSNEIFVENLLRYSGITWHTA